MTTPRVPSMMTSSSSFTTWRMWRSATTAGIDRLRATMAVWPVGPPTSVMKPATAWSLKPMVSVGERSWATMMVPSPSLRLGGRWPGWPSSTLTTRSTTCTTSALRSRR
jgi:hypothetical protein